MYALQSLFGAFVLLALCGALSEDRRRIHLILTDDGKAIAAAVQQRISDDFAAALDGVDASTLGEMQRALEVVERITASLGRTSK